MDPSALPSDIDCESLPDSSGFPQASPSPPVQGFTPPAVGSEWVQPTLDQAKDPHTGRSTRTRRNVVSCQLQLVAGTNIVQDSKCNVGEAS
ncbi:hypothetical protein NDU88_004633 [Pleurodeles waltl]|uniref:Uncharacterized protein n=1 Tax=Pleurodeles waltl TaxID=8319 RepID=A0AAV7T918_PLEWA|nr:hypothetical protein NDU88_004633 [Pleurodeles waltl]